MNDTRDVALFYAGLLGLLGSVRLELSIQSLQLPRAHRSFDLLLHNTHHGIERIAVAGSFLGHDGDGASRNPEFNLFTAPKPGLPSDGFRHNDGRDKGFRHVNIFGAVARFQSTGVPSGVP